jgi:hypothetical protein
MSTGATGVAGFQGPQGSYGPRGPTGLTGWSDQNSINNYGNNPTGPTGTLGYVSKNNQLITSAIITLTLGASGTAYIFNDAAANGQTLVIQFPGGCVSGTFWTFIVDPTAKSSSSITIQLNGVGNLATIHNQKTPSGNQIALTLVYTGGTPSYFSYFTHDLSTSYPVF